MKTAIILTNFVITLPFWILGVVLEFARAAFVSGMRTAGEIGDWLRKP